MVVEGAVGYVEHLEIRPDVCVRPVDDRIHAYEARPVRVCRVAVAELCCRRGRKAESACVQTGCIYARAKREVKVNVTCANLADSDGFLP